MSDDRPATNDAFVAKTPTRQTRRRIMTRVAFARAAPFAPSARATTRATTTPAHSRVAAVALSLALATSPLDADAVASVGQKPPPTISTPEGCTLRALDAFSDVRAKFSLEVSTGALPEAVLTLTGCDYSGKQLRGKILSGVVMDGTNFENADASETEMSRTSARNSNLRGVNFASANAYEARFDGSDLRGANFANALLSNASFGKGEDGRWANVEGAEFEGALLSLSDARKLCQNPTLDIEGQIAVGGC